MALGTIQTFVEPYENRGTSLPFDGILEFSRNERGRERLRLNLFLDPADGSAAGEELTIYLMKARRQRNEEVSQARKVFVVPPGVQPDEGYQLEWDLREIVYNDDKRFPVIRRGDYFFEVEHTGGTTGPSNVTAKTDDFRVAIYTVDRFEQEWLLGSTRRSNDDRAVRFQPKVIKGVRVLEVSKNHPLDYLPLKLSYGGETPTKRAFLSWGYGEIVEICTQIPEGIQQQYVLNSETRKFYIIVQVDPRKLPKVDTVENLLIDRQLIDRDTLRREIDSEAHWLEENFLHTPIEPALVVSDYNIKNYTPSSIEGAHIPLPLPENFDYDIKSTPLSYYAPTAGHWINLSLPFGLPLQFEYLIGALENTRIVDIPTEWIQVSSARHVELLPFNQSLAYHFIGLMYVHAMRGPVPLPSFWRYRYWAGIHDNSTPMPVLEALGMRAAVKALAILGQSFRGGFSSQSVSRDGVSESVGYTASAMYGIYSATIEGFKKRLEELLPQLKRKYYGIYMMGL